MLSGTTMPAAIRIPIRKPVARLQFQRHLDVAKSSHLSDRIALPHPVQPLHVYRHLLRASSYFPTICRTHIDDAIKYRFRRQQERAAKAERTIPRAEDRQAALEEEHFRRARALEEGKRKVASLNAAVAGDLTRFRRVIRLCFGRLGKKRRELIAALVKKKSETPKDSNELEELIKRQDEQRRGDGSSPAATQKLEASKTTRELDGRNKKEGKDGLPEPEDGPPPEGSRAPSPIEANWDLEKLTQYMLSQRQQENLSSPAVWPRGRLPNPYPKSRVPEKDTWDRPTSAYRAAFKIREWWKSTTEMIMPPLNKADWDLLLALGSGEAPKSLWEMPPRRSIAVPVAQESDVPDGFNWAAYAALPIRQIEGPWSRKFTMLTGMTDDGPYSQTTKVRQGPVFSNRRIRREFLKIWEASSYVERVEKKRGPPGHNFVWGNASKVLPAGSTAQQSIFEGVDSKGQLIRQQ